VEEMSNAWLSDPENQESLFDLCHRSIKIIAPDELPILDEVFPKYIALAQKGEVKTGTDASRAFGFAGEGQLIVLIIVPVLVEILAALLVEQSRDRISELKLANDSASEKPTMVKEFEKQIDERLKRERYRPTIRKKIAGPLARTFAEQIEGG
jgi:hypothetical protein